MKRKVRLLAMVLLKKLLLDTSDVIPETARKFRRVSVLKPEDVREILLGFEFENGKCSFGVRKLGLGVNNRSSLKISKIELNSKTDRIDID